MKGTSEHLHDRTFLAIELFPTRYGRGRATIWNRICRHSTQFVPPKSRVHSQASPFQYAAQPLVHDGGSLHRDATNLKRLHGLYLVEKTRIDVLRGLALNQTLQTVGMGINGNGVVFGQHLQAFHMVDVIVGDQYGLDVADA